MGSFWSPNQGDTNTPLATFLKNYLAPDGLHYNQQKNFSHEKPDQQKQYCNVGYALLGYLVECVTKQPFDQYCNKAIFQPLAMPNTAWYIKDLDTNTVAMPYHYSDSLGRYIAYGHNGYPDYPAGTLSVLTD